MPEISRFYGIVVQIYYGDHAPPHFHVTYGSEKALFSIETLALVGGSFPPRAMGLVVEWATIHQKELEEAFRKAAAMEEPQKIAPLP